MRVRAIAIEAEITPDPRDENAVSLDGPEIRLSQTMSALPHFVLLGTGPSKGSSPRTTCGEMDFPFLQKAPCLVTPPALGFLGISLRAPLRASAEAGADVDRKGSHVLSEDDQRIDFNGF